MLCRRSSRKEEWNRERWRGGGGGGGVYLESTHALRREQTVSRGGGGKWRIRAAGSPRASSRGFESLPLSRGPSQA